MLMHKSSLLLVLPLLLTTLPTGSVKANDLDIQTGSVRVTIDRNTGIRIESATQGTIFVPSHTPMANAAWSRYPSRPSVPTLMTPSAARSQSLSPSRCTGETQQSNQTNRSNGGISQTYSSTSTSVCR
jgi:hypothetical protein